MFNTVGRATGSCWQVLATFAQLRLRLVACHLYFVSGQNVKGKKSLASKTNSYITVLLEKLILSHPLKKLYHIYKTEIL
jgi:hypothetical protein